jgi:3',5'-cyclic AMP phosphodiesterase CpdA
VQRGKSDLAVTVLHVSDTQFGAYHQFSADDSLAGYLIRDVAGLIRDQRVPRPDLIVLSGDITERGKSGEFGQAREFLDLLCAEFGLEPERVVVVPGNHDINWGHSRAVFADWEADHDGDPPLPYPGKWKNYREFVTGLHGGAAFTEVQPYRLHHFGTFRVAVAALNSTMEESHREQDHHGWCGKSQLRWFADQLDPLKDVLRIGVVHHNVRRGETADNENLRDAKALTSIIGDHLDLVLHGHTHEGKSDYLADRTLVLATGSTAVNPDWRPADVPNQYQVLRVEPGRVTRWARQWDRAGQRWIADPRVSHSGNDGREVIDLPTPGWEEPDGSAPDVAATHRMRAEFFDRQDRRQDFTDEVARVTRVDLARPAATSAVPVETRELGGLRYVVGFPPGAPMRCVGVIDGAPDWAAVAALDQAVFDPLRSRGAGSVECLVVHHGPDDPELRARALRELHVRVKTWTEYNSLLETGPYRSWLREQLERDPIYPQSLYQPQRYRVINRFGGAGEVSTDLLEQVHEVLLAEDSQFVLALGDAGFGKSFLVRRLAWQLLGNERAGLTPIVVRLRDRDKGQSLEEMVSDELVPSGAAFQIGRFRHSLEAGTLALLIDGYDEFAVRVGYANAAAQLRTFTEGLRGRAKILLTTRPSHFRSTDEVTTKLFDQVEAFQGKVFQLEPFDKAQQRGFLVRWFEGRGESDPDELADRWMRALARVDNLPELAQTPRMLSFMVGDLELTEIEEAAGHGIVTAADLYGRLLDRWLKMETDKIGPRAPSVLEQGKRRELLEELALRLWRAGELDVTEDMLQQVAREFLDLPRLELTVDRAAQEIGGRTLLGITGKRWKFAHQSVYEYLLARRLARSLADHQADELLGEAELSGLTIRFLRDLAPEKVEDWLYRLAGSGDD